MKTSTRLTRFQFRILQVFLVIGFTVAATIPLDIFLVAKYLLSPEGFWQKLVVYGLGLYFLGFIQFLCLIGWCGGMFLVLFAADPPAPEPLVRVV